MLKNSLLFKKNRSFTKIQTREFLGFRMGSFQGIFLHENEHIWRFSNMYCVPLVLQILELFSREVCKFMKN